MKTKKQMIICENYTPNGVVVVVVATTREVVV